jgi:hypothetical protein
MPSSGIAAFGTLIKIGDGNASESFATIAEVTNITGPAGKTNTTDITNHSSTNATKEIVPTTIDPGTWTLEVNLIPTAITQGYTYGLIRDWQARNKRNFQLVWPNIGNTQITFTAYVTGFDQKAPVDGKLAATFKLDVTGVYTWAN